MGIEFGLRLLTPVRPGDTIELKWVVSAIDPKSKGDIVTLDGTITNQKQELVLTSVGKIMVFKD